MDIRLNPNGTQTETKKRAMDDCISYISFIRNSNGKKRIVNILVRVFQSIPLEKLAHYAIFVIVLTNTHKNLA